MTKNKILIIGATSAIAQAVAKKFAMDKQQLFLIGRNSKQLAMIADDLTIRSEHKVEFQATDLTDFQSHQECLDIAIKVLGGIDIVLIAHGTLPNQLACEQSFPKTLEEINTNCLSFISLLTLLGNYFAQQKHGVIAVITSVAGDRGRKSNYVYGTAKGAVTLFLQGLRHRLYSANVKVLTIKPGFVDTPMTQHFKKGILWSSPEAVSARIVNAIYRKKEVIYAPSYWKVIMWIIRALPEKIFQRLSL